MTPLRPISRRTLVLGGMVLALPTARGMAAPDPQTFITEFWTQATPLMHPAVPAAQRLDGIRALFRGFFDVAPITDFVLGRYKLVATPQQIRDFSTLYQEYTVQTYSRQLGHLAGARLVLQNARPSGSETVVVSNVTAPGGGSYHVDWYAIDRGGMYKISDLVIEGVSMKMTHRGEVARWIEINGGGFSSALAVLRQQIS